MSLTLEEAAIIVIDLAKDQFDSLLEYDVAAPEDVEELRESQKEAIEIIEIYLQNLVLGEFCDS